MNTSSAPRLEFFVCPLCYLPYTNPKVLPCLHSFCDSCLRGALPAQSFTLLCPVCRRQYILGPEGVSSFQSNPLLLELSSWCSSENRSDPECDVEGNSANLDVLYCSSHGGQTLRFYCNDCDSAVCSSCKDMEHQNHQTTNLEVIATEQEQRLNQIIELSKAQSQSMETAKNKLEAKGQVLEANKEQIQQEMNTSFDHLLKSLESRKSELELNLDVMHKSRKSVLGEQVQGYDKKLNLLTSLVGVTERILKRANPLHVILLKKQLDACGSDLLTERPPSASSTTAPSEEQSTPLAYEFHSEGLAVIESAIAQLGTVHCSIEADESSTTSAALVELSGSVVETRQAVPSRPYRILITVKPNPTTTTSGSCDSFALDEVSTQTKVVPSSMISVKMRGPLQTEEAPTRSTSSLRDKRLVSGSQNSIRSDMSSNVQRRISRSTCPVHNGRGLRAASANSLLKTNASSSSGSSGSNSKLMSKQPSYLLSLYVRSLGNNVFETVLTFPLIGVYHVDIKFGHQPIPGSPLKIQVTQPGINRNKSISASQPVFLRTDSCLSSASSKKRSPSQSPQPTVNIAASEDDLVYQMGSHGRSPGQFTNPQDICITSSGRVYATDSNSQSVQVFNINSEFCFRFGQRGRLVGQLQRPTGIASAPNSSEGPIYISDYENRWVNVMESNGKYRSRFGVGKLLGPKGVAVDGKGKIYVVDNKSSSICVFQTNGRFVGSFGSRGSGQQHLAGPHYLALNSFGHAIVSDFHNHAVKVFDSNGHFLYNFGSNGEGQGQFNAPTGIAVDPFDNVLVADWGNSRIQVFDRFGSFLQMVDTSLSPLYGPQGLALSPEGDRIFVADSGNHCVKVYKYENWVTNVSKIGS